MPGLIKKSLGLLKDGHRLLKQGKPAANVNPLVDGRDSRLRRARHEGVMILFSFSR